MTSNTSALGLIPLEEYFVFFTLTRGRVLHARAVAHAGQMTLAYSHLGVPHPMAQVESFARSRQAARATAWGPEADVYADKS